MAIPQTQSILRNYFTTGAKPTQAQCWELIDTLFSYVNSLQSQMDALTVSTGGKAKGHAQFLFQAAGVITTVENFGFASITSSGTSTRTVRLTFTAPLATADYIIFCVNEISGLCVRPSTQTTPYVEFVLPEQTSATYGLYQLVVFLKT